MAEPDHALIRLDDLPRFIEDARFDALLASLAEQAAQLCGAARCSIMLVNRGQAGNVAMSICGSYGELPEAALTEIAAKDQGIAGHVAATGQSLLIDDVHRSRFAAVARRPGSGGSSLMSAAIKIAGGILGVVNVSDASSNQPFTQEKLVLLEVMAQLIGKSVQLVQVQGVLNSRFAQIALANEASTTVGKRIDDVLQNPDQVARIVAKSFYKEMAKAGFGTRQIINAASEIITQLSGNIQRHNKRIVQETPRPKE